MKDMKQRLIIKRDLDFQEWNPGTLELSERGQESGSFLKLKRISCGSSISARKGPFSDSGQPCGLR